MLRTFSFAESCIIDFQKTLNNINHWLIQYFKRITHMEKKQLLREKKNIKYAT